jgi:hypothetical protein
MSDICSRSRKEPVETIVKLIEMFRSLGSAVCYLSPIMQYLPAHTIKELVTNHLGVIKRCQYRIRPLCVKHKSSFQKARILLGVQEICDDIVQHQSRHDVMFKTIQFAHAGHADLVKTLLSISHRMPNEAFGADDIMILLRLKTVRHDGCETLLKEEFSARVQRATAEDVCNTFSKSKKSVAYMDYDTTRWMLRESGCKEKLTPKIMSELLSEMATAYTDGYRALLELPMEDGVRINARNYAAIQHANSNKHWVFDRIRAEIEYSAKCAEQELNTRPKKRARLTR